MLARCADRVHSSMLMASDGEEEEGTAGYVPSPPPPPCLPPRRLRTQKREKNLSSSLQLREPKREFHQWRFGRSRADLGNGISATAASTRRTEQHSHPPRGITRSSGASEGSCGDDGEDS
ncbi:unnamed protein product [Linum tenue]|uniref:Uncharacterized protein n=1 Tax=Linum tenue TaxID=586396 RepID=A0AAV0I8X2_9ROSI|nr:unnamed protein product [Linum tenue]